MNWKVVFSRRSQEQLLALNEHLAMVAGTRIADGYTDAIAAYCQSLTTFPERGMRRDDLRPGLRVTHYRKRVAIAFAVDA
ncbi:MAG: plasmid stabilization protein, partial [Gammaproteobacteria bacterium HGW-Gammaproteobacteria-7]